MALSEPPCRRLRKYKSHRRDKHASEPPCRRLRKKRKAKK